MSADRKTNVNVDHAKRVVEVKQSRGLELPKTVELPFWQVKSIAAVISSEEAKVEAATLDAVTPARPGSDILLPSGGART